MGGDISFPNKSEYVTHVKKIGNRHKVVKDRMKGKG